ncbi:glycerate kinase [Staphylococcus caeli]|uniref:Glycerate kinase n=1 Tax=Staphylococcus caeli TaxID=2201815 RepID=A0A1D4I421_9STAP|nr:glycerate kinase [Staphylococcus caeli]SCS44088.1 glycerate kinase [Staphylococcus caeli]SCS62754.1 glycerate kinase [Staphylococcus caeli]
MKIILAPDSFKGSMSATEVATYMSQSISEIYPQADVHALPVGDGGEGTMESLVNATNGTFHSVNVTGPLGNQVSAQYGVLNDGKTCVIEMAEASGLKHIPDNCLNAMDSTTFGTGELILNALDKGFRNFIIALGGSATNDGGSGMLQALGVKLLDNQQQEINFGGAALKDLKVIDLTYFDQRIKHCNFTIASDVQNPLIGPNGASHVFGKQKGASMAQISQLDSNLEHWANLIAAETKIRIHNTPGAGAAGGLGAAFKAFFPNQFKEGIQVVIDYTNLEQHLKDADLIITGEGKIDFQTFYGKTPLGIAKCARKFNVPIIFIGGTVDIDIEQLSDLGVISAFSLTDRPLSLADTIQNSEQLITKVTKNIIKTFFHNTTF